MVIERRESKLDKLLRTKDIKSLFSNQETWVAMKPGERKDIGKRPTPNTPGTYKFVVVDPENEDKLAYYEAYIHTVYSYRTDPGLFAEKEEINKARMPWSPDVRYRAAPDL